jgi:hypothetical protein
MRSLVRKVHVHPSVYLYTGGRAGERHGSDEKTFTASKASDDEGRKKASKLCWPLGEEGKKG